MWSRSCLVGVVPVCLVVVACGGHDGGAQEAPTATATTVTPAATTTTPPTAAPLPTFTPTALASPVPTVVERPDEPLGFPVDFTQLVGWVDYSAAERVIAWGAGPDAMIYSRDYQPADDPTTANAGGWNCRVHDEFEGRPAVDWYIPVGTPVRATMDGKATLYAITTTNAFDNYGVRRAPYVGYPEASASLSPFPGPGGGKGIFVEIRNDAFVTESAHLELGDTLAVVPGHAYLPGFSADEDVFERFVPMRGYLDVTPVATWRVRRGDVIGYSGDSGYSEAPHLHYTIRRVDGGLLCPTTEAGFADGGWLFR